MGWDMSYSTSRPDRFVPGPDPYPDRNSLPADVISDIPACQATVTNQNSVLVSVSYVEIAYYDGQGNEISTATPGLPVVGVGPGNTVAPPPSKQAIRTPAPPQALTPATAMNTRGKRRQRRRG